MQPFERRKRETHPLIYLHVGLIDLHPHSGKQFGIIYHNLKYADLMM